MKTYSLKYRHNSKDWSLDYLANDFEDAQRKLQSIKSNAEFEGELITSIPCPTFIQKVLNWLGQ